MKVLETPWQVMKDFPHAISTQDGRPIGEAYGMIVSHAVAQHIVDLHNKSLERKK